jgi:hypothetical protein
VAFRDTLHGVAVGGDYQTPKVGADNVLATSDGGRSWTVLGTSAPAGVRYGAAWVPGTGTLVATGPAGAGLSRDGGRTWIVLDTASWNTADFASPAAGWTAGTEGRVMRWEVTAE